MASSVGIGGLKGPEFWGDFLTLTASGEDKIGLCKLKDRGVNRGHSGHFRRRNREDRVRAEL